MDVGELIEFLNARLDEIEARTHVGRRYVLADLDAKRRIVADHLPRPRASGLHGLWCTTCHDDPDPEGRDYDVRPSAREWPCLTIRALALPYADHRDYRDEWKP